MRAVQAAIALATVLCSAACWAQATPAAARPEWTTETFYLSNTGINDANEVFSALRNLLATQDKLYLAPSQGAILINAAPDQIVLAQKLLSDLDRPKKVYRLTYTLTESDGAKRIGVQHAAMIVSGGQRTVLKQGSKVPIGTGNVGGGSGQQTTISYIDVGLNFDATLDEFANGVRLRTKVEQSSVASEQVASFGSQDPVIRQTSVEGTSILTVGKPLVLGSLDIPGSTRHVDVEVMMEVVR